MKTDAHTVARWRRRYLASGLDGILEERPRSGRPRRLAIEQEAAAVRTALARTPPGDRWSTRTLARHLGMSHSRVARIWRREGDRCSVHPTLGRVHTSSSTRHFFLNRGSSAWREALRRVVPACRESRPSWRPDPRADCPFPSRLPL
ncbi:MAG: helix-turn-helix domain-containing protein [Phycisphaerales bacterium]|nr:helix-turn-helix domain-containing protein [Phycisphaerales bacterium]